MFEFKIKTNPTTIAGSGIAPDLNRLGLGLQTESTQIER